jgi:hypothetical protein
MGHAFHHGWGLVMSGGWDDARQNENSVVSTEDGEQFEQIATLPDTWNRDNGYR